MKKTIRNLALILMLVVAFTCISLQASAADVSALSFADCEGGVMITACNKSASGELTIPGEYSGKKVVKIADRAFENCLGITKVVMPDSIKTIGNSAFEGCTNLADVSFSYDLETIGSDAFFACDSLKKVAFYPNLTSIGAYAFYDCENLETVVIPDKITVIPEGAFGECPKLATLSLPISIDLIDNYAFSGCKAFKDVYYVGSPIAWYSIDWTEGNDGLFEVAYSKFNHVHDYKAQVTKEPDCTNVGSSVNSCVCGYTYRDNKVPALGHVAEKVEGIKATCEETGKTAGEKCSRCGTVITVQQVIPATGHNPVVDAAVASTCTATGLTEGSHCDTCGYVFVKQQEVAKIGHEFDYKNLTPATTTENGKRVGTCKTCGFESNEPLYSVTVFELSKTSYTYNGKARKPSVTVKDSEGNELIKDRDYTITYASGRKNPGIYDVTVKLQGEYEGTKTLSFTILPTKAESIKAKASKVNAVKLTWNEVPGATGYRIYIFNSATGTKKVKLTAATTNSYTLTKDYAGKALVMGTKYKISVTPYTKTANGKYVFASAATEYTFKFAPSAPTLTVTSTAKGKATLGWSNVAGETGYKVYTSTDGKTFKLYKTYKGWPDKQTISDLKSGTKYYFKVRAYTVVDSKTTVYGSYSSVKSIKVK